MSALLAQVVEVRHRTLCLRAVKQKLYSFLL
jgi:hypothetical protein